MDRVVRAAGRPRAETAGAQIDEGASLSRRLEDLASRDPRGIGFRNAGPHSAADIREITWAEALRAIRRLSARFLRLDLHPGAPIGIRLANRPEASLAILAAQDAGLVPCLLDIGGSAAELSAAISATNLEAVVTQTVLGTERPAETLLFVSAGFPRLRSVLAFGEEPPHWVSGLDGILRDGSAPPARIRADLPEPATLSFVRSAAGCRPVRRPSKTLLQLAAPIAEAARIQPGDRLITFAASDDLKGLVTGLALALSTGATLEPHELFDARALLASLHRDSRAHLVVPGSLEASLAAANLPSPPASVIFMHEPPIAADLRRYNGRVVDVLALGEQATLSAARAGADRLAMLGVGRQRGGVETRLGEKGRLWLRGPSVLKRTGEPSAPDEWMESGCRVDLLRDHAEPERTGGMNLLR